MVHQHICDDEDCSLLGKPAPTYCGCYAESANARIDALVMALMDIRARARFELEDPTPMRDTAFSLIEKTADAAIAKVKS